MKGLIFNLLDSMARQSGCADEAWDLVMEFVASETEVEPRSDTCLSCFDPSDESLLAFETPAEAMIQCLGGESPGLGESVSEFPEIGPLLESDEWGTDPIQALTEPGYSMRPRAPGCSEGYSQDLLGLLEQLLAEALTCEDEDEDEETEERSLGPSRSDS